MARVQAGSLTYPSYHGRDNFSYISLINVVNRSHEKEKTDDSAIIFYKGSPLNANTSARSVGLTPSRPDNMEFKQRFFFLATHVNRFFTLVLLKTIYYNKHCSKSRFKRAQSTLPVDVRGSKTSQLKPPSYSMLERFWPWPAGQLCSHINA